MNLWASMQYLEFNNSDDEYPMFEPSVDENEEFERFVDAVLMLRKPLNVDTFCLKLIGELDINHVNMWIVYAINHNARVLHLRIKAEYDFHLDPRPCLVTYHLLEELHVSLCPQQKISLRNIAEFSRLKRLHFSGLVFIYNDLQKLISGCPLIEDLKLDWSRIMNDNSPCRCISSKTMKTLRIKDCDIESMIRFSIHSLISLHYEDSRPSRASFENLFENLSSLVHAFIRVNDFYGTIQPRKVVDLIYWVSNAKILKLFGMPLEFIYDKEVPNLPTFPNLERLTIDYCYVGNYFEAVAYFLQHSPKLKYLTLDRPRPESCTGVSQSARILSFDCPHLKIIKIRCLKETNERVLDFVKTLQVNANAFLKIMIMPNELLSLDQIMIIPE